jgi:sec-independent protein translocase protein TatA
MPNLKAPEILLILLVVLLLFGAKRLPDLAKSVGKSLKILKNEVQDLNSDDRPADASSAAAPPAPSDVTPAPFPDSVTRSQSPDDADRKQV